RAPARAARSARAGATLDASSTSVFTAVSPTGTRGWPGGGHTAASSRSWRNATIRPPKNTVSPPRSISIPSRAFERGRPSEFGCELSSPSPPSCPGGPGGRPPRSGAQSRRAFRVRTSRSSSGMDPLSPAARPRGPTPGRGRGSTPRAQTPSVDCAPSGRPRARIGARGSTGTSRARAGPRLTDLVERHEREQERQIDDRRDDDTPGRRGRGSQRLRRPDDEEQRPQEERAEEVDAPREPHERRQEPGRVERETPGHDLTLSAPAVRVDHGQDADAGAGVVLAVEPGDGERVGQLP